jgi:hypothetical protein
MLRLVSFWFLLLLLTIQPPEVIILFSSFSRLQLFIKRSNPGDFRKNDGKLYNVSVFKINLFPYFHSITTVSSGEMVRIWPETVPFLPAKSTSGFLLLSAGFISICRVSVDLFTTTVTNELPDCRVFIRQPFCCVANKMVPFRSWFSVRFKEI